MQLINNTDMHISCESAHELYTKVLQSVTNGESTPSVKDPKSIGSGWGTRERLTRELRYITLILKNPQNRLINSPFFLLEDVISRTVLATLSDVSDVQTMTFYNPRAPEFSDDGKTIPSNYGYRIRHLNYRNQIDDIIDLLQQDPYSRRAVIHVHAPGDSEKRYTPCIDSLHFLIRNGSLECHSLWRSGNALMLLPINIFEFTMLQELIASELKIPMGQYVHTVTSLHYYLEDQSRFDLALHTTLSQEAPEAMRSMPFHSLKQIELLRKFEKALRLNLSDGIDEFAKLSDYWQNLAAVIAYMIAKKRRDSISMQYWIRLFPWKRLIKPSN
ncbi:MAG: hypothetical protein C5B45_01585 [Chlamydiae bacterium]|nr:MAG: hypothetical protein C5B45_01585 [Chlamydiota bacterium]